MSLEALNAAWRADVSPPARKLVLLHLAHRHNGETGQLNPSVSTVAHACGLSEKQARRHIHDLIEAGLLEVTGNHFGGNISATRHYKLNLEVIHTPPMGVTPPMDVTPPTDGSTPLPLMGVHPSHTGASPLPPMGANKERKGIEKELKGNRRANRAAKLPDGFYPNEAGVKYAEDKGVPLAAELESFTNFHQAKGSTMLDWQAAWRTWCDKAVSFGRSTPARRISTRDNFDAKNCGEIRKIGESMFKGRLPRRENFDDIDYGETGPL